MDWSGRLRRNLADLARTHAEQAGAPFYESLGDPATVLFEPYDDGGRHGSFIQESFETIIASNAMRRRLEKPHQRRKVLPPAKRNSARELDSSTSSDALLMNIFCYPGAARRIAHQVWKLDEPGEAEFGIAGRVPLNGNTTDSTEIDMRLGQLLVEAKLCERTFTSKNKKHVEGYVDFAAVFHAEALPQDEDSFLGYQLIRNVLAAHDMGLSFTVLCDARRPDLVRRWWAVHAAIREWDLRKRCKLTFWQEVAACCPLPLREFLQRKYGLLV